MAKAWEVVEKVTKGCELVVALVAAGESLVTVWGAVQPFVGPLLAAGVFSPETFWERGVRKGLEIDSPDDQLKLLKQQYGEIAAPKARSDYAEYLGKKPPEELAKLEKAYEQLTEALRREF